VLLLQGDPFLKGGGVREGKTLQKTALLEGHGTLQAGQAGLAQRQPRVSRWRHGGKRWGTVRNVP
jgi:hypothetical protein